MTPTVIIQENGPLSTTLSATNVDDADPRAHIYRLLLQALMSVEREGTHEYIVSRYKLELLRGFLNNIGVTDKGSTRRLFLMTLLQLEDEDNESRFVLPFPILPLIIRG